MRKRKLPELDTDHPRIEVSADFGSFEVFRDCYHMHPISKSKDSGKELFDRVSRGRRSMRRGRREKKTTVLDDGKNIGSIAKACRKSWSAINKPEDETETSDVVFISSHSVCNDRVSRRMCASTRKDQKGKLGCEMFEIHLESIWRKLSVDKTNEFAHLSPLWFSLYRERNKAKVLSWIKKKDIFSKKYVFVPILLWRHWSLLIFCHFGENSDRRCMLLLDSMKNAHSEQLEPEVRRFVIDIFKTEERPENKESIKKIPFLIPKVPQQQNGEACGFFVLYYIYQALQSDLDNITFSKGCTHFMKEDWFTPEDVECFVKSLDSMTECSDCSETHLNSSST